MMEQEWERQMMAAGVERFTKRNIRLERSGRDDETPYGLRTTGENVDVLAQAIEDHKAAPRREGRPPVSDRLMKDLSAQLGKQWAEILAAITIQTAQRGLAGKSQAASMTALHIGRAVERNVRLLNRDREWQAWPENDSLHLGIELLGLFEESCSVIEAKKEHRLGKHSRYVVRLTDTQQAFRKATIEDLKDERPKYMPTIEPPKSWDTQGQGGGYHYITHNLFSSNEHPRGTISP